MDREAENHIRFVSLNLVHCRLMKMRQGKQNIVWEWNFAAWLYFTTYLFDKNYVNTSEAKIFYYYMHKITAKILHGDKQLLHNDNRDENYLKISQQLFRITNKWYLTWILKFHIPFLGWIQISMVNYHHSPKCWYLEIKYAFEYA